MAVKYEKKNASISFRVPEKEKAAWEAEAKRAGTSLTKFIRERMADGTKVEIVNSSAIMDGLFQIITLLNEKLFSDNLEAEILDTCEKIVDALLDLKSEGGEQDGDCKNDKCE